MKQVLSDGLLRLCCYIKLDKHLDGTPDGLRKLKKKKKKNLIMIINIAKTPVISLFCCNNLIMGSTKLVTYLYVKMTQICG